MSNPSENHHNSVTNISSGLYIEQKTYLLYFLPLQSYMKEGFFFPPKKAELVLANVKNQDKMKSISLQRKKKEGGKKGGML